MNWSWKLGEFRGIAVRAHPTFLLLLGWILLGPVIGGHGMERALGSAAFVLLLFSCVVLHEFGHALTAQHYGIGTRDITLYPMGGVARLEQIPREPRQELRIALAGPAVNGVIALALFGVLAAGHAWAGGPPAEIGGEGLIGRLLAANLILGLFNLVPAFPMDGGRVLRALLAGRMDFGQATHIAAAVGQGLAFLFAMVGLQHNLVLLLIALMVYLGAAQEEAAVQTELSFRGVPASRAMMTRFETLTPADPLTRAMELLLTGAQQDFPVVENGVLAGLLTRAALYETLQKAKAPTQVDEVMVPDPTTIPPHASLEEAFQVLQESDTQTLPVVLDGRLVGLITSENIAEFVMLRHALEGQGGGSRLKQATPREERTAGNALTSAVKPVGG